MDFEFSPKVQGLRERLLAFMDEHIYPNEELYLQQVEEGDRWEPVPLLAGLKERAKEAGLWNLFLPKEYGEFSAGLTTLSGCRFNVWPTIDAAINNAMTTNTNQ